MVMVYVTSWKFSAARIHRTPLTTRTLLKTMEVVWLSDVLMLQHVTTMRQRITWIWICASMTRVRILVVRTASSACNYDPTANHNDGTCDYES